MFVLRLWQSRFNLPRRLFWKIFRFLVARLNLFAVSIDFQNSQMQKLGLSREDGLVKLNDVLQNVMGKPYDERDGMFSEHLVLFSSISVARPDINRILEIGTFDSRTALILSHLFPDAEIITVDLPSEMPDFHQTYNRRASINEFVVKRDGYIKEAMNVELREVNSLNLCNWQEYFDLIWIDGAHGYTVVAMDVINSYRLANKDAFVLIDDIWKRVSFSDAVYKSVGGFDSLTALVSAKLISEYFLFSKRLGYVGLFIRRFIFKRLFQKLGSDFSSEIGIKVTFPKHISLGNNFSIMRFNSLIACKNSSIKIGSNLSINENVNINASNGGYIEIGDNVLIASNVVIRASDHDIFSIRQNKIQESHVPGKIIIGNIVWIGSNCVILKDVTIGDNVVIGAGTVVTKDIEKNRTVVGSKQTIIS